MASGSQRRHTTVHDRAALRLHPDGTRVTARESRYATRDLRGNRIATNAGGTGKVRKRRRAAISDDESEPQEEFDIETDEYRPSEDPSSTDSCSGAVEGESEEDDKKRKRRKKDPRRMKRSQFYQSFDFVVGSKSGAGAVSGSDGQLLPSSDLLKCLHHFAANYYSNEGQLIDTTRIARQKKRTKMGAGTGKRSPSRSTAGSISSEDSSDGGGVVKQKGQQGAGLVKDMYKMFDGSALVALGVFVHERIERFVRRDQNFEIDPELALELEDDEEGDGDD